MAKIYTDYSGCKKRINLVAGISEQDFLTVLCWDYTSAARFALDWAGADMEAATSFIGGFLWRVLSELDILSSAMDRKNPSQSGFQTPGTSVCSVAFQRFCELLHENPDFVYRIRETPPYSNLQRSEDFLARRYTNWFSLTRDISWGASRTFKDPEPIPQEIRAAFRRQLQVEEEEDQAKQLRETKTRDGARQAARQAKKADRLRQAAVTQELNKQKSEQRRVLRENFLSKSVHDQLVTLATDTDTPLTVFPFNPRAVPDDALTELDDSLLGCLQERAAKRWEAWWKHFTDRIGAIRTHRTRG